MIRKGHEGKSRSSTDLRARREDPDVALLNCGYRGRPMIAFAPLASRDLRASPDKGRL